MKTAGRDFWLLCGIMAAAAALRFFRLDYQSFWFDEASSLLFAKQPDLPVFFRVLSGDVHPPLYFLILRLWIGLAGDSDWALRCLSALAGIAVIPAVYWLGTLLEMRKVALLACALAAFSPFQIWYSQEARAYSLVTLLSLLSMGFLIRMIGRGRRMDVAGYILFSTLLLYSHYLSLLFLAAQTLICLLVALRRMRNGEGAGGEHPSGPRLLLIQFLALGCCALLFLPWLPVFLRQLQSVQSSYWIAVPGVPDYPRLLASFLIFRIRPGLAEWIAAAAVLLMAAGAFRSGLFTLRSHRQGQVWLATRSTGEAGRSVEPWRIELTPAAFFAIWLFVPPLFCWLLSQIMASTFINRVLIFSSAGLYLLLAELMMPLRGWKRFTLIILVSGALLANYPWYYLRYNKENWRGIVSFISREAQPGDQFVFEAAGGEIPFRRYYGNAPLDIISSAQQPSARRLWYVRSLSRRPKKEVERYYAALGYRRIASSDLTQVFTLLFEKKPDAGMKKPGSGADQGSHP